MIDEKVTTTRSVAEIEAELKAAQELEAKRKRDAELELRTAKRQQEIELTNSYMNQLRDVLTIRGIECSVQPGRVGEYGNLYFATLNYPEDSEAFRASASPRLERRSGGYASSDSYQIQFGGYGERKTYPRLKDGTFKYDKIAADLIDFIKRQTAERQRRELQSSNYKASEQLEHQLESEFPKCSVYIRANSQAPDVVTIKFERPVSMEQARELLTVIQKITERAIKHPQRLKGER